MSEQITNLITQYKDGHINFDEVYMKLAVIMTNHVVSYKDLQEFAIALYESVN